MQTIQKSKTEPKAQPFIHRRIPTFNVQISASEIQRAHRFRMLPQCRSFAPKDWSDRELLSISLANLKLITRWHNDSYATVYLVDKSSQLEFIQTLNDDGIVQLVQQLINAQPNSFRVTAMCIDVASIILLSRRDDLLRQQYESKRLNSRFF